MPRNSVKPVPPPPIVKAEGVPTKALDSLQLNRLAGGITVNAPVQYMILTTIVTNILDEDYPIRSSPVSALALAGVASFFTHVYTSGRLRQWFLADVDAVNQIKEPVIPETIGIKIPDALVQTKGANFNIEPTLKAASVVLCSTAVLHVIAVLLGAPFVYKASATLLCAFYVSTLALTPAAFVLPSPLKSLADKLTWIRIFISCAPRTATEQYLQYSTQATVLGALLGALPLPLDWAEPWQTWPNTIVWSAFFGNIAGNVLALLIIGAPRELARS